MNKPGMAAKNGFIEKKSRDFQPVSQGHMLRNYYCWTTLSERNDDAVAAPARRCFTRSGESGHHALRARPFGVFAGAIEAIAITGKPACCPQAD
jgi:hypothetical protein